MIEIKILDKMPNEIMEIVRDIRSKGYMQGVDFDFSYYPPRPADLTPDPEYNRCTTFSFYKEEMASWFTLKYL